MNATEQARWKSEVLDVVFVALAGADELKGVLVYKGARVLALHLGVGRQSLDIDSNMLASFNASMPDRDEQRAFLEGTLRTAIGLHFDTQNPVVYELKTLKVTKKPSVEHARGWNAFEVRMNVNDLRRRVLGLPVLTIDIAAPETLLPGSVTTVQIDGREIRAYCLERIAGEKLRAFLSSLPTYRRKVSKPGETIRAKDLYDVARIRRERELTERGFWDQVGAEFRVACASRFIDCDGLGTFREAWAETKAAYDEPTIPRDIAFEEVETTLIAIVERFIETGVLPFTHPLPEQV